MMECFAAQATACVAVAMDALCGKYDGGTHTHTHTHTHACMHACTLVQRLDYIHQDTHTYTSTHIHPLTHTHTGGEEGGTEIGLAVVWNSVSEHVPRAQVRKRLGELLPGKPFFFLNCQ